jgi:dephospho-CoA kinase
VLSEWLAKDPESKAQLQEVGWGVMTGGKQTELNQRLVAQVVPGADVAVDGLRHPIDYESLRNSFLPSFHLLYIDSPSKDRWQRLHDSGRYTNFGVFEAADAHPVEQHIESLRANAALIVQNQGSLEDLYAAVDDAIRGFRKEGHI